MSSLKFKNTTGGRYTKALFYEETLSDKPNVLYTLKDQDHQGYPSLYRLYMEENDPTEYRVATKYLDGLEHWEQLCECSWFKPYIERWRRELELRMKSESLARIMREAKAQTKESFSSNKYLLEKGWEPKEAGKRGRPSKQDIREAAQEHVSSQSRLSDDMDRLGIKLN